MGVGGTSLAEAQCNDVYQGVRGSGGTEGDLLKGRAATGHVVQGKTNRRLGLNTSFLHFYSLPPFHYSVSFTYFSWRIICMIFTCETERSDNRRCVHARKGREKREAVTETETE